MKQTKVILTGEGDTDKLELIQAPIPDPGPNQVLLRVEAVGVARADILMRTGHYPVQLPPFPFSPGYDVVGRIEATGSTKGAFSSGDRVGALVKTGGYSEYILINQDKLVPVPDSVDPAEAVCLILNGLTAYQSLYRLTSIGNGDQVLFHAAASGVGLIQLQLGQREGLKMFATASGSKHDAIREFGAKLIDYREQDFLAAVREHAANGLDAAFDPIGGLHLLRSFRALRKGGRLIAYGELAIATAEGAAILDRLAHFLLPKILRMGVFGRSARWYENYPLNQAHPDWYQEDLLTLFGLLERKEIDPHIYRRLPLRAASKAHELLESRQVIGKIVLLPTT